MKYPSIYLVGERAHGEVLSIAFAGDGQGIPRPEVKITRADALGSSGSLSEEMDEPPRWLKELAEEAGLTSKLRLLEEGLPQVF